MPISAQKKPGQQLEQERQDRTVKVRQFYRAVENESFAWECLLLTHCWYTVNQEKGLTRDRSSFFFRCFGGRCNEYTAIRHITLDNTLVKRLADGFSGLFSKSGLTKYEGGNPLFHSLPVEMTTQCGNHF
jgi:hypothetical protein